MGLTQIATHVQSRVNHKHSGLPTGWQRDRFRQLCATYATISGCSSECVRTLEIIIDFINPQHFTDTHKEPLCFARQENIVAGRSITEKTVFNHERQLEAIGLIERRLAANGSRCKRKGLGLVLSPAINAINLMMQVLEDVNQATAHRDELRGKRSFLMRQIRQTLNAVEDVTVQKQLTEQYDELAAEWPRADKLKRMDLNLLEDHLVTVENTLNMIEEKIAKTSKISGQPALSVGCRIQDESEDKKLPVETASQQSHRIPRSKVAHGLEEVKDITNDTVYELSSDYLKHHICLFSGFDNPNAPTISQIERGIVSRFRELGISYTLWEQAVSEMGLPRAVLLALVADGKISTEGAPIANPGGYVRALLKADEQGQLNLSWEIARLLEEARPII